MGYNDMDALWTHKNGSVIYVGNKNAAKNIHVLRSRRIYSIVNCTHGPAKIPNFHASLDGFNYFEFQIAEWMLHVGEAEGPQSILNFVNPLFAFIDAAIHSNQSILIHCLVGAHRAGTTACLCLMNYENLSAMSAIQKAKSIRPIIDPIAHLPELLKRFEAARTDNTSSSSFSSSVCAVS